MLQQSDLLHMFLQVPVPLLLFLLVIGVVVEEHRQEEVAGGCGRWSGTWSCSASSRDLGHPPLPFQPTRPIGVHFRQRLLRNAMMTAVEFFNLFFTVELINNIVTHTNSYAYEHIETHQSYAKIDGRWQEATADDIRRLIAILIYFGLVRVSDAVDIYWSVRSPYLGLWGKCFLSRIRFKALMATLHVVDPANEPDGDKFK